MLRTRLVVFLMIRNGALYKSVQFSKYKYIGDPLNSAKIFNDFKADELLITDISARENGIDFKLLENLSSVCRMPICYGGGVKNLDTINRIISLGIEKISLCTGALTNNTLLKRAVHVFGRQSIVGCLDLSKKPDNQKYYAFTHNGTKPTNLCSLKAINLLVDSGVGEILVNNIDADGTYKGVDINLLTQLVENTRIPVTILGGVSSISEIEYISHKFGPIGIAASSLWCFNKGTDAVLLNYPEEPKKSEILI